MPKSRNWLKFQTFFCKVSLFQLVCSSIFRVNQFQSIFHGLFQLSQFLCFNTQIPTTSDNLFPQAIAQQINMNRKEIIDYVDDDENNQKNRWESFKIEHFCLKFREELI